MENEMMHTECAVVWQSIFYNLRTRILSFDLLPGDMLSENVLAAEMNVSRTPVRDAMTRLAEEGYVVVYPQRGTVVSLIGTERVRQAVFLRVVLEHAVVDALCRQGLSAQQVQMLEDSLTCQRAMQEEHKVLSMLEEDDRMHHMLYEFAGHPYTEDALRMIDSDQMRVRYLQMHTFSYNPRVQLSPMMGMGWENCLLEHRMLLDALKKGDSEAACLIDVNHINAVLWNTENLRKIYPQYFSDAQQA
ncbi:MAG: GntR family transcriptional regulator [Ruthenibacterium sp.]